MKKFTIETAQAALNEAAPKAQQDPLRPQYHFLPPANWMNDPNGTLYIDGTYHLFYQLNPFQAKWGHCCWGHARSTDLVHWEHLPIALVPDHERKENHCFSGCCVMNGDQPIIFYTSIGGKLGLLNVIRGAQQWAAVGDHDLIHWQRIRENPVVNQQMHRGRKVYAWRDPYVWQEDGEWRMILSGKHFGEKFGSVFIYRSPDLKRWEYMGRMCQGNRELSHTWECPNLLKFENAHVLIISPIGQKVIYSTGMLSDYRFTPQDWYTLDHGKDFYATNTYRDEDGYKLVGWLNVPGNGHWRGCMCLPRRITLDADQQFSIRPVRELEALRSEHLPVKAGQDTAIEGNCLEAILRYPAGGTKTSFGVLLEDGTDSYPILLDVDSSTLTCLNEKASLERLVPGSEICLHIFIDHSVVEVFVNYREAMITWFRPELQPGKTLRLRPVQGGDDPGFEMDVWKLKGSLSGQSPAE